MHMHQSQVVLTQTEHWWVVAAGSQDTGGGLAASPWSMPAFFLGWIGIGVLTGLALARRGHDRPTMAGLGAGLGPMMFVVAAEARRRRRRAQSVVLSPGVDHGGSVDVLVLLQDRAEQVLSVVPTLEAVASDVGRLTLARAVPYEWLDDRQAVEAAASALLAARELVPIGSPALVLFPGGAEAATRHYLAQGRRTVVLHAIDDPSPAPDRR